MKNILLLTLAFFACLGVVHAQSSESSPVEIYGGYSYLRASRADLNFNGFNVGGSVWLNKSKTIGITGDYTFHTRSDNFSFPAFLNDGGIRTRLNTVQAGPTFRFRKGRLAPFSQVLIGATRTSVRVNQTNFSPISATWTDFSISAGGGLDVDLTKSGRIALRVAKAEYIFISTGSQQNFRFSTGLVLRL